MKGASNSSYTLSNRADYGSGVIKSIASIALYHSIVNKIKVSWSGDLFGSGQAELGNGLGLGKQLSLSNKFISNKFMADDVSSSVFSTYSYVREYIKLESMLLFFLELADVCKIQIEHPLVYIDGDKEWLLAERDFDINSFIASFGFIERLVN